ncbi:MAG: hypothetical protein K8S55_06290 [Phycisphaerae bacterium]|nr:hypothetical protein [Phycisphaerae bacterium]
MRASHSQGSQIARRLRGRILAAVSDRRTHAHADPNARGGWIGITSRTGRNELVRSVMEGVTFAMGDVVNILKDRGLNIRQIRLHRQIDAFLDGTCRKIL